MDETMIAACDSGKDSHRFTLCTGAEDGDLIRRKRLKIFR